MLHFTIFAASLASTSTLEVNILASHLAVCAKYRTHPQGVILPQSTPFQFYLPLARTPLQTPPNAPGHANSRRYHRRLLQQEKDGSAWNLRHSHWRARGARSFGFFVATGAMAAQLAPPAWFMAQCMYGWVGGGMTSYAPAYPLCT